MRDSSLTCVVSKTNLNKSQLWSSSQSACILHYSLQHVKTSPASREWELEVMCFFTPCSHAALPLLGLGKLSCRRKTTLSTKCWMSPVSGPRTNTIQSWVKPSDVTFFLSWALWPNSSFTCTVHWKRKASRRDTVSVVHYSSGGVKKETKYDKNIQRTRRTTKHIDFFFFKTMEIQSLRRLMQTMLYESSVKKKLNSSIVKTDHQFYL